MERVEGKKKESSLHGRNLVGSYVDERSSLQEGGTDHQPLVTRPSYELTAEADKRTSYHFYPCAFSQVIAGFHHGVDRRNLLEYSDFFGWNGFGSHSANNANDTRRLENGKTPGQREVGKAIPAK
jgi:hypothetical protein